ncbi:helix-turn-helix domain-containing protein [Roseomonas sp. NAR14]|uniref:Helix-turn-helix domain-containing protein n=1 Tax=Roseomonas acroporae TaxID=2937791 RepID=A0A9X2BW02_9PROT|nr:helix-turn-helix domain-containing protein [Roseomonas acroporae]MCK8783300.1 helix-turn-helix domain-containing protein [Roseomonas acroporae]
MLYLIPHIKVPARGSSTLMEKTGTPRGAGRADGSTGNTLQTLDRGLQALDLISRQPDGVTVAVLATQLAVHRAIAYRLATTLEQHGLIARDASGLLRLGAGLLTLAARFEPQLRALSLPLLQTLARGAGAAAFVSVARGDECVAIAVAEPEDGLLRVAYRVGSRHPLSRGAAGIAILAGRKARAEDPPAVREARLRGVSVTQGELQRGAIGVASPVSGAPGIEASLGIVALEDLDVEAATGRVVEAARRLERALAGEAGG